MQCQAQYPCHFTGHQQTFIECTKMCHLLQSRMRDTLLLVSAPTWKQTSDGQWGNGEVSSSSSGSGASETSSKSQLWHLLVGQHQESHWTDLNPLFCLQNKENRLYQEETFLVYEYILCEIDINNNVVP